MIQTSIAPTGGTARPLRHRQSLPLRRAIREVGKRWVTPEVTAALAKTVWGSHDDGLTRQAYPGSRNRSLQPDDRQAVMLARELLGFPRHLSSMSAASCSPASASTSGAIGNAAMADPHLIEWDKDDIGTLGLMKATCSRSAC